MVKPIADGMTNYSKKSLQEKRQTASSKHKLDYEQGKSILPSLCCLFCPDRHLGKETGLIGFIRVLKMKAPAGYRASCFVKHLK
jgi:hypothetical protein